MKRLIILLCFLSSLISISATTIRFKATEFNYRERTYYSWSNWKSESCNIRIDMVDNYLVIHSLKTQAYYLYNLQDAYTDADGDCILESNFIDQDGNKGEFNLIYRVVDGMWQLYIRFSDIQWVYNVIQID